ncbi:MAG: 16S rRNA (cytosine(1402)-N(4))-methyltransferase RsmH [Patescibacteria group bacterium]
MSRHVPVLLKEAIEALALKPGANIVDCTLGDAGHSEAILERIGPNGRLLGIDADIEAVLRAKRFLYSWQERAILIRDNFTNLKKIAEENKFFEVNGILMDLGWSTPQFEERGRGLSFNLPDEPLDMRYEIKQNGSLTAAEILNTYSQVDLNKIFKLYGEEKFSAEIAQAIKEKRKQVPFEKVGQLVETILEVYRQELHTDKDVPRIGDIHPATKIFQALRIEVNHELENLKNTLPQAIEILAPGGRLAVISFHSLEDRIVKQYFAGAKTAKLINKKPIAPTSEEVKNNPKSRSAKLRIIEKL